MREWLIMLMPYFGRWPEWMNLFVESCKWNPDVRWRFFTDCGEPENKAANIEYVHLSFEDYKALVRDRLQIAFDPSDPYKLCDVRPAYGDIHTRDIANYRFFGWGDIDIIFGKIGDLYTDELLSRSNALSIRSDMFAGHFAVLRNTRTLRRAYRRIPGYQKTLEQPQYCEIDERVFFRVFRPTQAEPSRIRHMLSRFDPCRRGGVFVHRHTTVLSPTGWRDGTMNYPQCWFWKRGLLTNDRDGERGSLCLHFMRWKTDRYRRTPPVPGEGAWIGLENVVQGDWQQLAADGFWISPAGITSRPPSLSDHEIRG